MRKVKLVWAIACEPKRQDRPIAVSSPLDSCIDCVHWYSWMWTCRPNVFLSPHFLKTCLLHKGTQLDATRGVLLCTGLTLIMLPFVFVNYPHTARLQTNRTYSAISLAPSHAKPSFFHKRTQQIRSIKVKKKKGLWGGKLVMGRVLTKAIRLNYASSLIHL